ncbi:MAG: hypothetical protein AB7P22_08780, partial [Vicinamibacterales bacterium]
AELLQLAISRTVTARLILGAVVKVVTVTLNDEVRDGHLRSGDLGAILQADGPLRIGHDLLIAKQEVDSIFAQRCLWFKNEQIRHVLEVAELSSFRTVADVHGVLSGCDAQREQEGTLDGRFDDRIQLLQVLYCALGVLVSQGVGGDFP